MEEEIVLRGSPILKIYQYISSENCTVPYAVQIGFRLEYQNLRYSSPDMKIALLAIAMRLTVMLPPTRLKYISVD
jgi:hypothetical protein